MKVIRAVLLAGVVAATLCTIMAADQKAEAPAKIEANESFPMPELLKVKIENLSLKLQSLAQSKDAFEREANALIEKGCTDAKIPVERCQPDFKNGVFVKVPAPAAPVPVAPPKK